MHIIPSMFLLLIFPQPLISITQVQDSLWKLKEGLRDHLNKSQVSMDAFKQKVSDKLMSIINSEE